MGEEKQAGHTPTHSDNSNNHTGTGTERDSMEGRHRNYTGKKVRNPNTFKGSVPEVGAGINSKAENFKESFQNLQESLL